jgi:general secretion pathway protein G
VKRQGFSLVEMLVVIVIIGILLSLLAVWIINSGHKARYVATQARIRALDAGCSDYRVDNGMYPPMTYTGSQNLHFYLGASRVVPVPTGGTVTRPPYVEFPRHWLQPGMSTSLPPPVSFVYDAWDRVIEYQSPGVNVPQGVDIRSLGRLPLDPADDTTNWSTDY